MKLKLFVFLMTIFLIVGNVFGQIPRDKDGNIDIKRLTEEDAKRIYGDDFAPKFFKVNGNQKLIKESIIKGNKITTIVFNYGSICAPNRLGQIADLVWNGLGYGFEFGPLAAAEVVSDSGEILHIVDDSFIRSNPRQGDYSPDGTEKWGWLPKDGFVDPDQEEIATLNSPDSDGDGKPDSWPERWYSPGAGKYIWPAFLGDQATAPDEEVFYVVDDYTNREFPYFPFDADSTKRGLGLDMAVRLIQFNNPLAEDIIFLVYQITNASDKDLPINYFGMHGDPHVGGSSDFSDDRAGFVDATGFTLQSAFNFPQRARNMVYAWDPDGKGIGGRPTGYFGWKFLESPSDALNAFDDDDDGIIDETPENSKGNFIDESNVNQGIADVEKYTAVFGPPKPRWSGDEDGDWNPDKDDIGIDGIGPDSPNYPGPDFGEGDATPSQGWFLDANGNGDFDPGEPFSEDRIVGYIWAGSEPNFGLRDISESDQIGLKSFNAAQYTNSFPNVPANDPLMWEWLSRGEVDTAGQNLLLEPGDNIFNFGTGPLKLDKGETQRFSMCILFGSDLQDLSLNAETSTRILEADYRFAQPPVKPIVQVVPGDGKVTLYWDTRAEDSVDPLTGLKDFLGYKVYRSRDLTFSDVTTITDGRGNPFLRDAFVNPETGEKAQWHYPLDPQVYINGYHPVEYLGRAVKYWVGDPADKSGLVHEFVDSSVTNGVRYFYAVVAYDNGSLEEGKELAPSETQAVILRDPITGELTFDVNTAQVVPGPVSKGMINAEAGTFGVPNRVKGNSNGDVIVSILDDLAVPDGKLYSIEFSDDTTYSVTDSTGIDDKIISNDTVFVTLSRQNIIDESIVVKDMGGNVVPPDNYVVSLNGGRIRGTTSGSLPFGEEFEVSYRYFPVMNSSLVNSEDANPSFDGMRVFVQNVELGIDTSVSKFSNSDIQINGNIQFPPSAGQPKVKLRADWEVRFNDLDTNADGSWANVGIVAKTLLNSDIECPFQVINVTGPEEPATFRVNESIPSLRNNGKWDWGEQIILQPQGETGTSTSYEIVFSLPPDSVVADPVLPGSGDIFFVTTSKPFETGDKYIFQTKSAKFDAAEAKNNLDNIYVVPNPYVAFSVSEEPGRTSDKRGDRDLQFRNLPPQCTIKIFTITGDLVQTIRKDDLSSIAHWDLLSFEGQRVAYGVYIFHVDVPGVGEKIGRFAVIK